MANPATNKDEKGREVTTRGMTYDVINRGFDTSFWKEIAATVSVASDKLRLASGGNISSYTQFLYGIYRFAINVPTTPSAGEAKKWGLLNPSSPTIGSIYFEITGATFRAVSYDESGTAQTTTLTWSGEAAEQVFEIEWGPTYIIFKQAGTAIATHTTRVGNVTLSLYAINSDADNTEFGYITIKDAIMIL